MAPVSPRKTLLGGVGRHGRTAGLQEDELGRKRKEGFDEAQTLLSKNPKHPFPRARQLTLTVRDVLHCLWAWLQSEVCLVDMITVLCAQVHEHVGLNLNVPGTKKPARSEKEPDHRVACPSACTCPDLVPNDCPFFVALHDVYTLLRKKQTGSIFPTFRGCLGRRARDHRGRITSS